MPLPTRKPLYFIASSWKDLKALPGPVQDTFGTLLLDVQYGETPESAKPLKGFGGAGVLEIVEDHDGDTYRSVYTVNFRDAVYVLHVFEKKSTHGSRRVSVTSISCGVATAAPNATTPPWSSRRIAMREARRKTRRSVRNGDEHEAVYKVGDNVFADLGRPNAVELLAKAELVRGIRHLIAARGLAQAAAASLLGIAQPDVSNLHRGRLAGFSMERLYRFLNALGQDVQIVVQPKPRSRARATVRARVRAGAR